MDIATRIKKFMDSQGIASSKFADSCRIPRPTLSQILNGRNKKVSDEIIGKIHETYPEISVLWLMFGEGEMLNNSNIKISEAEISEKESNVSSKIANSKPLIQEFDFSQPISEKESENKNMQHNSQVVHFEQKNTAQHEIPLQKTSSSTISPPTISFKANEETKKIKKIIILYGDGNYDEFSPLTGN